MHVLIVYNCINSVVVEVTLTLKYDIIHIYDIMHVHEVTNRRVFRREVLKNSL